MQFPAAGRIPGNCDTWYAIAFTNIYLNEIREDLGLGDYGSFFHPVANPLAYGETSFALALTPLVLRAIGLADVTTYYFFISLVFGTTAFSVCLFATLYVRRLLPAAVAGIAFAASNYLLSSIDSPHTLFFGVAFLSLYYLKRHLTSGRGTDLRWSALLAGAQTYFSAYVFLFLAIALAVLLLAHGRELRARPGTARRMLLYAAGVGVLAAPFYLSYWFKLTDHFSWRPQALLFAEFNSLDFRDLFNPMPDNLIYPAGRRFDQRDAAALQQQLGRADPAFGTAEFSAMIGARPGADEESLWVSSRKRAFIGVVPYLLALLGASRRAEGRRELLGLVAIGVIVALGPLGTVGHTTIRLPLYYLYEYVPGFHLFRIPGRAFSLALLGLVVLAARGIERLQDRFLADARRAQVAAALLLGLVILAENVPFPMRSFDAASYAEPPDDHRRFFSARPGSVILELPSGIGYGLAGSADDLYVFNRELIYMNWQSYHGQTIVNGVNGYIPHSRIATQLLIDGLPGDESIAGLARIGVGYICFNKALVLPGEAGLLDGLRWSGQLEPVLDSDTTAVFRIRR